MKRSAQSTEQQTASLAQPETEVIFVTGMGRSGSTILGAALSQIQGVISVGELDQFTREYSLSKRMCSCGKAGDKCPFWSEVNRMWTELVGEESISLYRIHQRRFERLRTIPRLFSMLDSPTTELQEYGLITSELFRAISQIGGARAVVDTSKGPARGLALSHINGISLHLLHLIRDGRGVMWSRKKRASRRLMSVPLSRHPWILPWRVTFEWIAINRMTERIVSTAPKGGLRIYYEQFALNPDITIRQVASRLGIDSHGLDDSEARIGPVSFEHTIGGNTVRFGGDVAIRIDEEWRSLLPKTHTKLFWLFAGRLAKRYGYLRV